MIKNKLEHLCEGSDATGLICLDDIAKKTKENKNYRRFKGDGEDYWFLETLRDELLEFYKGLSQKEVIEEFESPDKIINKGRIALLNLYGPEHGVDAPPKVHELVKQARNSNRTYIIGGYKIGCEHLDKISPIYYTEYPYFTCVDANEILNSYFGNFDHVYGVFQMINGAKILIPHAIFYSDADDARAESAHFRLHAFVPE